MDRDNRDAARTSLAEMVRHYKQQNDRFERWLDERDRQKREAQTLRLATVAGRGEHGGRDGSAR